MTVTKSPLIKAILLLLIAMFSIQYGASIAKGLFPIAGAAGTTALRVGFSAVILIIVTRLWKQKIPLSALPSLAVYGVSLGLMNLLFYFALERIPLGIAVALEFTGPLAVAILATKRWIDGMWAVLAAVGIYLILPQESSSQPLDLIGVALALGAGLFWGFYIIFGKRASAKVESHQASAVGMVFAALATVPVGIYLNSEQIFQTALIPFAIMIAILSSALPYSLEMRALKNMPTKTFGILMSLEPAIATLMGFLFLKEYLNITQWIAIACIMVASAGTTFTAKSAE